MPEVSVITPLYNGAATIASTIASVQEQFFQDWEMVIVDDCSSDGGPDIVKRLQEEDSRIKLFRLMQNGGPARTRNYAMEKSEGRFMAFLDADDRWSSDKLEKQIAFMKKHDHALTYSWYHISNGGTTTSVVKPPPRLDYKLMLRSNFIGCLTATYDCKALGGKVFMPDIRKRQDYGLWLRILRKIDYAYCIEEDLAEYRVQSASVSSNKFKLIKYNWELFRDHEQLSLFRSLHAVGSNVVHRILRN